MQKTIDTHHKSKTFINMVVLAIMVGLQLIVIILPSNLVQTYFLAFRPIAYTLLLICLFTAVGRNYKKTRQSRQAPLIMGMVALIYFSFLFIAGLLFGFGKNPMFTNTLGFLENLWTYVSFVILTEIIRIMLIKNTPEQRKVFTSIAVILVFTFVQIENLQSVIRFDLASQIDYEIVTILPLLVVNGMLTYVAFSSSFSACLILRATYALAPILLPVLPNISKILWSIVVYVVIFIGFVIYDHLNFLETRHPKWQKYSWKAFIIPGVLVALCISFGSGLMPWQPLAVASSSMKGAINKGSIALVKKIPQDRVVTDIQIGDIIQYRASNTMIIHRVIDIKNDYLGEIVFVTKGDTNPAMDVMPVKVSQVVGVTKAYIPLIGWPAVWMSEIVK